MELIRPKHISDALEVLNTRKDEVYFLGGGYHTLVAFPSFPKDLPEKLSVAIDLSEIKSLSQHREEFGNFILGSTVKIQDLYELDKLTQSYPILQRVLARSYPNQVRNQATLGGVVASNRFNDCFLATLLLAESVVHCRNHQRDWAHPIFEWVTQERVGPIGAPFGLIYKVFVPIPQTKPDASVWLFQTLEPHGDPWNPVLAIVAQGEMKGDKIRRFSVVLVRGHGPMAVSKLENVPLDPTRMVENVAAEFESAIRAVDKAAASQQTLLKRISSDARALAGLFIEALMTKLYGA